MQHKRRFCIQNSLNTKLNHNLQYTKPSPELLLDMKIITYSGRKLYHNHLLLTWKFHKDTTDVCELRSGTFIRTLFLRVKMWRFLNVHTKMLSKWFKTYSIAITSMCIYQQVNLGTKNTAEILYSNICAQKY